MLAALLLAATAALDVAPRQGTVGDPLRATITVTLDAGEEVERVPVGPDLGEDVAVLGGAWAPTTDGKAVWTGTIAAYATGPVEVPPIELVVRAGEERRTIATGKVALEISSVLPEEERAADAKPEPADLKPPATIAPDWRSLKAALAVVAALLVAAALSLWLWRRLAPRLSAVPAPADPFRRLPPHVWAYEELRLLLDGARASPGPEDLFFDALARIVKQYLSARLRVDLLERTTGEVPALLAQAGLAPEVAALAREVLERSDLVRFARVPAGLEGCRASVESAFAIVDATKPREEGAA